MLVVFGATGFLGRYVLAVARKNGLPIRAISRSRPSSEDCAIEWVHVDFTSTTALEAVISEGDTVINLAFSQQDNENHWILDALLKTCARKRAGCFIHCSTAVVVGRSCIEIVTEDTPCEPINRYERLKMALEQKVMSAAKKGLPAIIVRPTAMVGPGGSNLASLAHSLVSGSYALNYLRACIFGDRNMHLIPAATVAEAIIYLARDSDRFSGETYILAADEDPDNRFPKLERLLTASLGLSPRRMPILPMPRLFLSIILKLYGRTDTANERTYSSAKIRATGFLNHSTISDAVASFGRWYLNSKA